MNEKSHLLFFTAGGKKFAVPAETVREVILADEITPVTDTPESIRGVTQLRETVITVIDIATALMPESTNRNHTSRTLIITEYEERLIGFSIDKVNRVLALNAEEILEPDPTLHNAHFLKGMIKNHKQLVFIVDLSEIVRNLEYLS